MYGSMVTGYGQTGGMFGGKATGLRPEEAAAIHPATGHIRQEVISGEEEGGIDKRDFGIL